MTREPPRALPGRDVLRRVDRLARTAHAFHRFAHHPLCQRYQGELVPLGRKTRLCRGCTLAVLGVPLGAGLGLAWSGIGIPALAGALLALGLSGLRPGKFVTRLLPAAGLSAAAATGTPLFAIAALMVGFCAWALYRRRGPDRRPCESCPEWKADLVCSGFRPILRREEAFRRLSSRWLNHSNQARPAPRLRALSARVPPAA